MNGDIVRNGMTLRGEDFCMDHAVLQSQKLGMSITRVTQDLDDIFPPDLQKKWCPAAKTVNKIDAAHMSRLHV